MDRMNSKLYLNDEHWNLMREDIIERISEEACGIVAGIEETSCAVFPVTNILHSPVRFRMAPEEQLYVFNQIEDQDLQLLAIYHSHLKGPDRPSPIDIAEAYYPELINLIWSNITGEWNCRGFLIDEGQVTPVPVVRLEKE
jgi:proteasome lid subunit RPN8/RPN11